MGGRDRSAGPARDCRGQGETASVSGGRRDGASVRLHHRTAGRRQAGARRSENARRRVFRAAEADFEDYGGEAYILDYPNPVDRLRGKTGSGIWVHSRGHAVTPRESRGCVVLNLKDIAVVGPKLRPGTPVVIGETAKAAAHPVESEAVRQVERRTRDWCEAWERQAPLDALYAPENDFARRSLETDRNAQRRFAKRGGKPRFGTVRALEGPGYWVSWFTQRAPDGTWSGIRRLYWQRIGDGFLIVGEEGGA